MNNSYQFLFMYWSIPGSFKEANIRVPPTTRLGKPASTKVNILKELILFYQLSL